MRYPTCRSSADRTLCSDKFAHASSQGEEQSERCCGSRFFDPPSWFAGCGSPSLILPDNSLLAASTEGVWVKRELTVLTTRSKVPTIIRVPVIMRSLRDPAPSPPSSREYAARWHGQINASTRPSAVLSVFPQEIATPCYLLRRIRLERSGSSHQR